PVLSKATGVPLVGLATRIMLGETLAEMGYGDGLLPPPPYTSVKAPVFSFEKLGRVDVYLSPEMKSTGEVLGLDPDPAHAMYKALVGAGAVIPTSGTLLITLADKDKAEGAELAAGFVEAGFQVMATRGTAAYLRERGLPVTEVHKIGAGHPDIVELIQSGAVDLLINTPTRGRVPASNGFRMRRACPSPRSPHAGWGIRISWSWFGPGPWTCSSTRRPAGGCPPATVSACAGRRWSTRCRASRPWTPPGRCWRRFGPRPRAGL